MARIKRTHLVMSPILHNDQMYVKGDTITFGPEVVEDHIRELRTLGYLAGPEADELEAERIYNERIMKITATSGQDIKKLWKRFLNLTPEQRKALEAAEARQKDDVDAARLANLADTKPLRGPIDDEPAHGSDDADDDSGEDSDDEGE